MAKVVAALTNTQVKQAKPKLKEYKLSDGNGLQLRVKPTGSKTWIFNYSKPITNKRTTIGFGAFPDTSLSNARTKRNKARELLAQGIDPRLYQQQVHKEETYKLLNTFGIWATKWKELKAKQVKHTTITKAYSSLNRYVLPEVSSLPISTIKPLHIIPLMKPLIALDKRETVKRLCMFINEIMRLALAGGAIEHNPLQDLTRLFPTAKTKHQLTIKPSKLPELMTKINHAQISKITRCMFELQLHTMVRPIEAASARWCDFNLTKSIWVIPPERMKMKKPHIIPLSNQVLKLLSYINSYSGHKEYLFPNAKNPLAHANSQTVNMMLKRNGYHGQLVAHGLRALASTALNEQGFEPDVIEVALAHVDKNSVRRAYNRGDYFEKRKVMMQWWSNHISSSFLKYIQ